MATTKKGTYYPDNYEKIADVPADFKKMAESIDKQFDGKVDKIEGKGLSTNDFTNEAKDKLDGLSNYNDAEIKQDIADLQGKNTSQDELIDKLKGNMFNLTAEGTSINVQDSSDLPAVLEVSGGVKQATREGYNLLNNTLQSQTVNGVTVTVNEDKSVTLNGTSTGAITLNYTKDFGTINGDYIFYLIGKNNKINLQGIENEGTVAYLAFSNNNNNVKKIYETDTVITKVFSYINAGTTFNNETFYPMITKGTEEKPYEQYGASPSPDHSSNVETVGDNVNLCPSNLFQTTTINGITFTCNEDGTITVNGTATENAFYSKGLTLQAGDYCLSGCPKGGAENKYALQILSYMSGDFGNGASFTLEDETAVTVRIMIWAGVTVNNIGFKPKIEPGKVATSYSPYGMGSLEIKKVNKNWFDKSTITEGRYIDAAGSTQPQAEVFYSDFIKVFENSYIYISNRTVWGSIALYDKSKQFIKRVNLTSASGKYLIEENTSYIKINGLIVDLDKIQIELGEISTDYTLHESKVYNLPIQQPMLSGYGFVKEDGNWFEVHGWKKYVFTGDENISYSSVNNVFYTDMFLDKLKGRINFISNSFKVTDTTNYLNMENYSATGSSDSVRIIFKYTELTSIDQFKQFLKEKYNSGNSVYVWYQLATPTKLPCTPEQVEVLEQLYNMPTYRPVTNIFTKEDLANLKLNYVADSKIYVDNKINAMQANLNTINQLLSTTATSALLLNNMQTDLESEVI